jgi:CRP/FNR family transcriptional regulator, cyclic AMP receptor protein
VCYEHTSRGGRMDVDVKKLLKTQTLFSAAPETFISRASRFVRPIDYKTRDSVFYQGDPRSPLVLLNKGQLHVSTVSESGVEVPLKVINPGEYEGVVVILSHSPNAINVTAVKPSVVSLVNRADARLCLVKLV